MASLRKCGQPTAVTMILLSLLSTHAAAIPIKVTDKNAKLVDTVADCSRGKVRFTNCTSTAFINTETSLAGNDADFASEFNAWNATNPLTAKWTLANGGVLPGGMINVTTFRAVATHNNGGLDIMMTFTGPAGFAWTQGLNLNYKPAGTIVPAFDELDVVPATAPLYPFQGGFGFGKDTDFKDLPRGFWPDSSFAASTFLSTVDRRTRTLTIYEGVRYGFKLSATTVPEPAALTVFGTGLIVLGLFSRHRRHALVIPQGTTSMPTGCGQLGEGSAGQGGAYRLRRAAGVESF
jgi:hypothetical protein